MTALRTESLPRAVAPETILRGRIGRVLSHDEETGATFARFQPAEGGPSIAVRGVFTEADLRSRELTVWGRVATTEHGAVFRVSAQWRGIVPGAGAPPLEGVKALCVELLHGIGPKGVERLAEQFGGGDGLWTTITSDPAALSAVIGPVRGAEYHRTLMNLGLPRMGALATLMGLGCTYPYATRVLDSMGSDAIRVLSENPYRMVGIPGIKFSTADRLAQKGFGLTPTDPRRLAALCTAVLEDAAEAGDTSLARAETARRVAELGDCAAAGLDPELLIDGALATGLLAHEMGDIYLPRMLAAERRAASGLARLIARTPRVLALDPALDPTLAAFEPEQRRAVELALTRAVVLVNGRPGTGKTTVAREIVRFAQGLGIPVHLAATTAVAAEKLTDAITRAGVPGAAPLTEPVIPGTTVHSLAGAEGSDRHLPRGIVIIDEASMLDLPLLARVLDRCGDDTTLVFLGDPNQLPPVMAGNSSRDIRDSHVVPTVELVTVHRQARNSLIALNAERILLGKMPLFANQAIPKSALRETGRRDLSPDQIVRNTYFRKALTPLVGSEKIVDTVDRLRTKLGIDPVREIQVFVPTKPGIMGTSNINRLLQALVNPCGEAIRSLGVLKFRIDPSPGLHVADGRPVDGPAKRYSPISGDTIELQRAEAKRGLTAGERGTVVVQTDDGGIRVRFGTGVEAREHIFGPTQFDQLKVVHELELRVGDPVLHGRNDAARGLKNGMRGIIQSRTPDGGAVVVYPSRTVTYSKRGLSDLALAYATTVHKAQGQENRVAILGAHHAEHRVLLDRALLYVGLTRATEMAFCIGTPVALRICLREAHGQARHTRLADRTANLVARQVAEAEAEAEMTVGARIRTR